MIDNPEFSELGIFHAVLQHLWWVFWLIFWWFALWWVFGKSDFIPTLNNEYINLFDKLIMTKINNSCTSHTNSNISSTDSRAIQSLKNNRQIIIKSADKGSAIIILDRSLYQNICETTLADETYYKKLNTNPEKTFHKEYLTLIRHNSPQFTSREFKYLSKFEIKPSIFNGSPC